MVISVKHNKVSAITDDPAAAAGGEVLPSDWNADHVITGLATVASTGAYSDLTGTPGNASGTTTGLLTSTDWTTFNNKQAAGTYATGTGTASGTNTGDETTSTIKSKLGSASSTTDGYLTSADWNTFNGKGAGTVTSVGFTGGVISVATPTSTPAFTVAGTSGGIPYFSSGTTWASSGALAANSLVVGGGAGVAPSTITTGTGVTTALGVAVGSAGAFVTFNGALGTPSSGTVTNLTGTASININGTVGATTPNTGAFTSFSATSNAVGSVTAATGGKTAVTAVSGSLTLATGGTTLASQVMAAGSTWRITAYGTYAAANSANTRTLTMACYWGTTALTSITTGNVLGSTAQTTPWKVEFEITGSSATAAWVTGFLSAQVTSATIPLNYAATAASTTGLTTTSTLDFRVGQTGTATATDTINVQQVVIERID